MRRMGRCCPRGEGRPGRPAPLFGCLIHEAGQGWTRVRWFHFAAGAWKAESGVCRLGRQKSRPGAGAYFAAGWCMGRGGGYG